MPTGTWGGSGGWNGYDTTIGGVSAVNPQAQGNYQQYQDAAFANAQQRLDPILQQQRSAYDQQMVNMGLPVGGEAYNKAFQQLDQNQNDAWSNAAFGAMQFGLDVQNQDFTQDATRAGLANALLQSQWDNQLGYYNTDTTKAIADGRLGFDYANLGEQGRQFDLGLGEDSRQFDLGLGYDYSALGENARQFDGTLGLNYADLIAGLYKYDNTMDYNYFNADREDMRWLTEFGADQWNQQINNNRWSDQLATGITNPYDPAMLDPSGAVNSNNRINQLGYDQALQRNAAWWAGLGDLTGAAANYNWGG